MGDWVHRNASFHSWILLATFSYFGVTYADSSPKRVVRDA